MTNWAGNIRFAARATHRPNSLGELRRIVAASRRLRVLGSGHSFNRIADTSGDQVSIAGLPFAVDIDSSASQARVSAGARYGEVSVQLDQAGFALPNLGSLPHISIAGACSTGTHGSGSGNQVLASSVRAIELVTATGDLARLDRTDPDFPGAVLALGALGVVTEMTLDLVPSFQIQQQVYEGASLASVAAAFADVMGAAYSVSVFTDLRPAGRTQIWLKHRVDPSGPRTFPTSWLGAQPAIAAQHPLPEMSGESTTAQFGVPGPWNERLPHFRLDFTPSNGVELQSEYFIERRYAGAAIEAMMRLQPLLAPMLQVCELRTIAADELWLSPHHRRDTAAVHFTWLREPAAVAELLVAVERELRPFGALPHWGKVFVMSPAEVRAGYSRFGDFARLADRFDPEGIFRNATMDAYLSA